MHQLLAQGFIESSRALLKYPQKYGIEVTEVSTDGREIHLTFVFRKGHRFCCEEPGCHIFLLFDSDYEELRKSCAGSGVEVAVAHDDHHDSRGGGRLGVF